MYSVVLLAALSTGANAPANCLGLGCRGCHGCHSSCSGCYGCSGYGCYGCYGYSSCHGCYGCYTSYSGCYGSCHGCYTTSGCHGCYSGCHGCYASSHGCYGGCWGCHGSPYAPSYQPPPREGKPGAPTKPTEKKGSGSAQAKLVVEIPVDAQLYVDDQLMKSSSARREFSTPALEDGVTYYYILRAEMVLDGQKHMQTRQVILRAGDVIETSFPELQRLVTARAETTASR